MSEAEFLCIASLGNALRVCCQPEDSLKMSVTSRKSVLELQSQRARIRCGPRLVVRLVGESSLHAVRDEDDVEALTRSCSSQLRQVRRQRRVSALLRGLAWFPSSSASASMPSESSQLRIRNAFAPF